MIGEARVPFFDGHLDTFKRLYRDGHDFRHRDSLLEVDLPRAREAGMIGGLFAIQVPAERAHEREYGFGLTLSDSSWEVRLPAEISQPYATAYVDAVLNWIRPTFSESDKFRLIQGVADLEDCVARECLGAVLHYEGAEAIKEDLSDFDAHLDRGLRSLGLVWSRPNAFGCGAAFRYPSGPAEGPGLTVAGRNLIRHCEYAGVLVDLAHISDAGFWDAARLSRRPLVVSHAGAQRICPSSTNLTDEQLDAVGGSGGVVGILFDVVNSRRDGRDNRATSVDQVLEHIEYISDRIGIEHVAIGSDFDGGMMPHSLRTVSYVPGLFVAMSERGYSSEEISCVASENWLRVLRDTLGG